jgi:hypothetical protein
MRETYSEKYLGLENGDLIISNHQSYIDLFYYSFRYCCTFATIYYEKNELKIINQSFSQALISKIFNTVPKDEGMLLKDILLDSKK